MLRSQHERARASPRARHSLREDTQNVKGGWTLLSQPVAVVLLVIRGASEINNKKLLDSPSVAHSAHFCILSSMTQLAPTATPWLDRFVKLPNDVVHATFAALLDECRFANDRLPTKGPITRWHAKVPSPIESATYLHRQAAAHLQRQLNFFTPYPRDALLLSLWYMDRISLASIPDCPQSARLLPTLDQRQAAARARASSSADRPEDDRRPSSSQRFVPQAIINSFTLHRLVLSTLLVASKFISDGAVPQVRAAKVGGVSTNELVRLEVEALAALEWDLDFSIETVERVAQIVLDKARQLGRVDEFVQTTPAQEGDGEHIAAGSATVSSIAKEEDGTADARSSIQATPRPSFLGNLTSSTEAGPATPLSVSDSDASVTSSQTSSTAASPKLFDTTVAQDQNAKSSPPPSPPSSAGYMSDEGCNSKEHNLVNEETQHTLVNRASTETVRRLQSLSMS
ncbi:hypothetical protein OIV83_003539 [Microbotryomycetes sp. JL201]|nr:hypothetical protein OIV83_003539 [Microbotryomycetes sp. JL201]